MAFIFQQFVEIHGDIPIKMLSNPSFDLSGCETSLKADAMLFSRQQQFSSL